MTLTDKPRQAIQEVLNGLMIVYDVKDPIRADQKGTLADDILAAIEPIVEYAISINRAEAVTNLTARAEKAEADRDLVVNRMSVALDDNDRLREVCEAVQHWLDMEDNRPRWEDGGSSYGYRCLDACRRATELLAAAQKRGEGPYDEREQEADDE